MSVKANVNIPMTYLLSFVVVGFDDGITGKLFCCTNGLRGSRLVCDWEWPITFNEHRWSSIRLLCVLVNISKKSSSFVVLLMGPIAPLFSLYAEDLLLAALTLLPSGVNYIIA